MKKQIIEQITINSYCGPRTGFICPVCGDIKISIYFDNELNDEIDLAEHINQQYNNANYCCLSQQDRNNGWIR